MEALQCGLHWWTFTTDHSVEDVMDRLGGAESRPESIGGYGHPKSITHESGARIYYGSRRDDQPVCVNMPGEVCELHAADGVSWAEDLAGVVTRADLALDLGPAERARGRMIEMRRAWKAGRVDTRVGSFEEHRSEPPGGWTWYFGGRTSELRLRVYDRRGPLRLEFQWKPEREAGRTVPRVIATRGASYVWKSLGSRIRFPLPWYEKLITSNGVIWPATVADDSLLMKVIEQLQLQLGGTLWALQNLGVPMSDLVVPPEAPMRGDLAAKFLRWAAEAEVEGYDGEQLRSEVKCRLKSQPGSKVTKARPGDQC